MNSLTPNTDWFKEWLETEVRENGLIDIKFYITHPVTDMEVFATEFKAMMESPTVEDPEFARCPSNQKSPKI